MAHYKRLGPYQGVGEHRFEGLASEIAGSILRSSGQYRPGWITKRAGDGGIDFVSRLDLGSGPGSLKLVVLGQAKCIAGAAPVTSGLDLARTVARLDRGWVGAFVTTGYFSDQAQREVVADRFPLLMLNGRHVGETVVKEAAVRGLSVGDYIQAVVMPKPTPAYRVASQQFSRLSCGAMVDREGRSAMADDERFRRSRRSNSLVWSSALRADPRGRGNFATTIV